MIRITSFLLLIAAVALGAAWIADQTGSMVLTWNDWQAETSLPVFAAVLAVAFAVAILLWTVAREIWRIPARLRRARTERRRAKGRQAITRGLIAIGSGDAFAARGHAQTARKLAHHDPLALLLDAQAAQLAGDRDGAQRAFHAMAEREDTRLLGLRGLFVEAQRADDPLAAVTIAEEALRAAPGSAWASQAVLGFACARGDWSRALAIVDDDFAAGLINKQVHRRRRGVLLTARALELEATDRDQSRATVNEAVKLAPTLVPAVALAAKYLSESQQVRRAMRLIEPAWTANPHPDLADAYAHVRLGDSALERLARVESLAARTPGNAEGALAVARAAIDAREFARARAALQPLLGAPTQRMAMLMAEIERTEHGDEGAARSWTLRAVRAAHDAVWTADGYVSDRWYPVSPVTGQIDAFQWQRPLEALPGAAADAGAIVEPTPTAAPMTIEAPVILPAAADAVAVTEPPAEAVAAPAEAEAEPPAAPVEAPAVPPVPSEKALREATADIAFETKEAGPKADGPGEPQTSPHAAPQVPPAAPPLFRPRRDLGAAPAPIIPVIRPPDDPGVPDDDARLDEYDMPREQPGGWRGFLSRLGV